VSWVGNGNRGEALLARVLDELPGVKVPSESACADAGPRSAMDSAAEVMRHDAALRRGASQVRFQSVEDPIDECARFARGKLFAMSTASLMLTTAEYRPETASRTSPALECAVNGGDARQIPIVRRILRFVRRWPPALNHAVYEFLAELATSSPLPMALPEQRQASSKCSAH